MNLHFAWEWFWFLLFALIFVSKRAFFGITGPSPVANNLKQYVYRAGVPVTVRLFLDSLIFWVMFFPQLAQSALRYFGWEEWAGTIAAITAYSPVAALFGYVVDSFADFGIGTLAKRIPFLGELWPQMPGPLPQKAVVEAQIVQQTVTQLQLPQRIGFDAYLSTTTVVPKEKDSN